MYLVRLGAVIPARRRACRRRAALSIQARRSCSSGHSGRRVVCLVRLGASDPGKAQGGGLGKHMVAQGGKGFVVLDPERLAKLSSTSSCDGSSVSTSDKKKGGGLGTHTGVQGGKGPVVLDPERLAKLSSTSSGGGSSVSKRGKEKGGGLGKDFFNVIHFLFELM